MEVSELNQVAMDSLPIHYKSDHLLKITDDTGVFQHCRYDIPDRLHGYTLDDNARALIVAAHSKQTELARLLPTYLSFVMYCQRPDGLFRNFMSFDRHFLEKKGSPDAQGRTVWALGVLYEECPQYRSLAEALLYRLLPHLYKLKDLRPTAFTILGLCRYLRANPHQPQLLDLMRDLADQLVYVWKQSKPEKGEVQKWRWFEGFLSYENARLPQALLAAYHITNQAIYKDVALEAAAFLEQVQFEDGFLKVIGNQGWFYRGQSKAEADEQPVDAGGLVEMYALAYQITGERRYQRLAQIAFGWFCGWNSQGLPLYNPDTGSCYDGLVRGGTNLNQGSESVLSYIMAVQALEAVM